MAAGTPGRGRIGCSHANRPLDSYRSHPRNRHRVAVGTAARAKATAPKPPALQRGLPTDVALKPWKGDFDGMVELRRVRVLAPYSRTFYFNELGRERGYAADLVRLVETYLNAKLAKQLGNRPLTFLLIPTTRDKLISGVADGIGDIAVNLGVSEERKKIVDFIVAPDAPPLAEVVLTGPTSPVINSVDDLSGKTVHTRPSSTYHESLVALNERFKKAGKPLGQRRRGAGRARGRGHDGDAQPRPVRGHRRGRPGRQHVGDGAAEGEGERRGRAAHGRAWDGPSARGARSFRRRSWTPTSTPSRRRRRTSAIASRAIAAASGSCRTRRARQTTSASRTRSRCSGSTPRGTSSTRSCSPPRDTRSRSSTRRPGVPWAPSASCK